MSETITLPRSGVVLRSVDKGNTYEHFEWAPWSEDGPSFGLSAYSDGRFLAGALGTNNGFHHTRDECIAWLDERVLELRSALLPPGAFILPGGEGMRERVARLRYEHIRSEACSQGYGASWPDWRNVNDAEREASLRFADSVLAALREASRG